MLTPHLGLRPIAYVPLYPNLLILSGNLIFFKIFSKEKLLSISQVEDFILVAFPIEEGPQEGKFVHFVGRIMGIEEDGKNLSVSFLRIKSPFNRDTFYFPLIEDVTDVARDQCLGVLTIVKGSTHRSTQRTASTIKVSPPLYGFDMR